MMILQDENKTHTIIASFSGSDTRAFVQVEGNKVCNQDVSNKKQG